MSFVPTHIMLRAALKLFFHRAPANGHQVPTHTMLRAALKQTPLSETSLRRDVPTHTMLRAVLTAKRLCVSFWSHRAVFVCKKRTAILTMRRTDVRIEIQKGHCLAVAPITSEIPPPGFGGRKAGSSLLSFHGYNQHGEHYKKC